LQLGLITENNLNCKILNLMLEKIIFNRLIKYSREVKFYPLLRIRILALTQR